MSIIQDATATPTATLRRLSPQAAATGSRLRLLAAQVKAEILQNLRVPEYLVGVVGVPVILFTMFGLPEAGQRLSGGTDVAAMIFVSMACYGMVSLSIFTFGVDVAQERGKGWLRRLRATPMPMWAYFAGKIAMAVAFAATIVVVMGLVAVVAGGVHFEPARALRAVGVLLLGAAAFSTMGFALAFWTRPKAASAIGNLVFLPLSFLSGFFYTLANLPSFFQDVAQRLPTYHFGQLVWGQMAPAGDIVQYGSLDPGAMSSHVWPVLASFVGFGALAALGYRHNVAREAR